MISIKTLLISFQPKWYEQIKSGKKIYEYRTQFPKEPVVAYMYVSNAATKKDKSNKSLYYPA